jgi:glutamate dehydrogenase
VRKGELNRAVRDEFLASMRDEVAELCLANTVAQTRMLSIESFRAADAVPEHIALIEALEATGELSRRVDRLPENGALSDRARFGEGLTRPELAQLLAHAKNQLQADLLDDHLPVDPFLGRELFRYFPPRLREAFATAISTHQLRPEIIATVLANGMINAGGPAFANELQLATSAAPGAIALAYLAARDVFSTPKLEAEIDALDGQVPGRTQLLLYRELQRTIRRAALWFLRNGRLEGGVQSITERHAQGLAEVKSLLPGLLTPRLEAGLAARSRALEAEGVSPVLASRFAELASLAFAPDIMLVAERLSRPLPDVAASFFGVLDLFGLGTLADDGHRIVLTDRFDRLALDRALANLLRAQRDICADVLSFTPGPMPGNLNAWRNSRLESVARASDAVARLATGEITVSRLSVAAGLLSDLARGA